MRIVRLIAENIKKLKAVEITPTGDVVQVSGANGSGKTSVLDSIMWALAGTKHIDSKPVRDGAEKGLIELDLGDITVTRRLKAGGGSSLTVEAKDGTEFKSPQSMLDKYLGPLSFDPLEFSRMDAKQQLEQLRKLVKIEVDIDGLDFENRRDFEARTTVNRRVKELDARVGAIVIDPTCPTEPVDVSTVAAEMEVAIEHNRQVDREVEMRKARDVALNEITEDIERVDHQMAILTKQRQELTTSLTYQQEQKKNESPVMDKVDIASFRSLIANGQTINARVAERKERDRLRGELAAAEGEATALTRRMDERAEQKRTAIAATKMPIDGLGIGEGEVTYRGLPFAQASSAEQLRVSVAIAMAANPDLRVLRIKDGSLLDEKSLAMIAEMATAEDFQVWIEVVDTSGKVGIVMEDGEVAAVNA